MSPDTPLLEVRDLVVAYGAIVALRGVSLGVNDGEIVAVLGPNGAGKSTLLRTISGLVRPRDGAVLFTGALLHKVSPEGIVKRGVSMVPEGRRVFPHLAVSENLRLGTMGRRDRSGIDNDYEQVFTLFPVLKERLQQAAGTLSGGEQQQLVFARSLMSNPKVMLLDEPSLGLAPVIVDQIMDLIVELRRRGVTILMVEQNAHRALEIADRAYVLSVGSVVLAGTADEVAQSSLEQAYLGFA